MAKLNNHLIFLILLFYSSVIWSQTSKPNIVLILADDLGYADLSVHGSKEIKTPHIDALGKRGVTFTQAYVSSPVCSPSRAGLLTGRNQVSFGYDNNLAELQPGFDPEYSGLPIGVKTIPEKLKEANYYSSLIGKWHLGQKEQFHPLKRGFDEFWGYLGGGHDYFSSKEGGNGYLSPIACNYKTPQAISYITDDKGDECVDFIKRNKAKPFFLFASFNAPHSPMQALTADLELFSHIQDKDRKTYLAMVYRLDINVGKIIKALKDEGLEDNTIVVFLSDNGGPVDQNSSINLPLNGQKGILLEGGIRVPMIMVWPTKIKAGIMYHHPVSSLDLMPTFLAAADVAVQQSDQYDGVNLIPFLMSGTSQKPHKNIKWRFTISAAILEDNWKLIRLPDRLPYLFDLSSDISEKKNVALEHLDITKRLLQTLGVWDVSLPHPVFLEGAEWKIKQLMLYDKNYFDK